ncbi:MAG: hypothetical protein HUJ53_06700 [Holdemanella sp.]|nr:hypothetical protein [Holdemanella sp.]
MNLLIVIVGGFLGFLISMIVLVKREENREKRVLKKGVSIKGKLESVSMKGKSASKNSMRISYYATYSYIVNRKSYKVKTIFEMDMGDVTSQIPETISISYNKDKPQESYVVYESNDAIRQQSPSKGIPLAIGIGIFVGLILYHFLIQRII